VIKAKLAYNESSVRKLNTCDPSKVKKRGEAIINTPNICAHNTSDAMLPISISSTCSKKLVIFQIAIKFMYVGYMQNNVIPYSINFVYLFCFGLVWFDSVFAIFAK